MITVPTLSSPLRPARPAICVYSPGSRSLHKGKGKERGNQQFKEKIPSGRVNPSRDSVNRRQSSLAEKKTVRPLPFPAKQRNSDSNSNSSSNSNSNPGATSDSLRCAPIENVLATCTLCATIKVCTLPTLQAKYKYFPEAGVRGHRTFSLHPRTYHPQIVQTRA